LLENNELRTEVSANALKAVNDKYNWSRSIEPLAQIYEKLISSHELSPKLGEGKYKTLVSRI